MKIVSIIGTRPQYIKVKPIYEYCKVNDIDHIIIDTNQHYSDSVSKNIIEGLNLKIDINLGAMGTTEVEFIGDASKRLQDVLTSMSDIYVLIYGDTNSSFAAALTCYKNKIKFAHVEAGARCFNINIPEEVNRMYIDSISNINFCSVDRDSHNVNNAIVSGDLEYELLDTLTTSGDYSNYGLMTVHRQSNITKDSIQQIFNFCEDLGPIILPIHHRLKSQNWFSDIRIPANIQIIDPLDYQSMVDVMTTCRFIITDSGGVIKTCPFFGKKTLILREEVGWIDTLHFGYSRICHFTEDDKMWVLNGTLIRDTSFYKRDELASSIIINNIIN
jgi:UDP-GlcNAc3NAcA epimerase